MASVCVCACGFKTDGGQLCPDWKAFGLKVGQQSIAGPSGGTSTAVTDGWTIIQFTRINYVNDTCQTQRVEIAGVIPYVNMQLDNVNYWDFAVYAGAQLDVALDSATFTLNVSGRVRKSNPNTGTVERVSVPARTPEQFFDVPPARTLYIIGSTWKNILTNSGGGSNDLSYNRLEVNYKALPAPF